MVGIKNVIKTARSSGITTKLDANLSLALGSSAVSPLEMAGAYATFARAGKFIKPQVIRRIEDDQGHIYDKSQGKAVLAFSPNAVFELVDCLKSVVSQGTGKQAALLDRPAAGKTGTADQHKDVWFVGFTPDLATAVWAGNEQNLPVQGANVTGGEVSCRIWRQYNQAYYQAHPQKPGSFAQAEIPERKQRYGLPLAQARHKHAHGTSEHKGFFHRLFHWLLKH